MAALDALDYPRRPTARRSPLTDFVFVRSGVAGRIPIVAVGVPARGVKGGLARLLHRKRARTQRLWGVRGSGDVGFAAGVWNVLHVGPARLNMRMDR